MNDERRELMLDLLSRKAVYGLEPAEERELAELQRESGGGDESLSFELTAAAIGTTGIDSRDEMPAALRERILAESARHIKTFPDETTLVSARTSNEPVRGSLLNWLGWAFAAAACVALALNVYYTRPERQFVTGPVTPTPTPEKTLTPSDLRQALILSAPDLARANWGAGNLKEVAPSGDVVWSDAKQEGYVRLSGLPQNDPNEYTYQLWIVAENQDPKTPVDGGTFNIGSDGEVIIPINAKVKALNPQAFAITMEKPGGVPFSTQLKVPALAKRET